MAAGFTAVSGLAFAAFFATFLAVGAAFFPDFGVTASVDFFAVFLAAIIMLDG